MLRPSLRTLLTSLGVGLALLLSASSRPAQAQLSDEAQISLITILPGDLAYSMFGHTAFRVYDPTRNLDIAYNYGTFSFGNPLVFIGQFAYGKLDYQLSDAPYPRLVNHYWHNEGRPVIEQVLYLSAAQRNALYLFLENNLLPENRFYRYDFFFDNCSTRPRDVLEQVLGDAVQFAPQPDHGVSLRRLLDPYLVEKPVLHFLMDLGLGLPSDRTATPREAVFLPMNLMEAFDHTTVTIDGQTVPLVARTDTVFWSEKHATLKPSLPWPSLLLWGLFVLGLVLTWRDLQAARSGRRVFDGVLFGVVGITGVLIVFLWFISLHAVTHGNLNLFWAWPTHLVAAVALARRSQARWLRAYLPATALTTLGMALAFFFLPQEIPTALLPLLLLLAVRSAGWTWVRRHQPPTPAPA